jgi:prepilin-type N-terminal cleavage/methylation domain-containing protein
MKKAFTLIELLISIVILSILMLFLYQSYAGLNKSNETITQKIDEVERLALLKKTLYLDFYTAKYETLNILHQDAKEDVVFFQTANSIHQRFSPYVAYVIKNKTLYRLESLRAFSTYPLEAQSNFVADKLDKVILFRVYKSTQNSKKMVLVHIVFENEEEVLLKIPILNTSYKKIKK